MISRILRNGLLAAAFAIVPLSGAIAGPVVIDGTDAEEHGSFD